MITVYVFGSRCMPSFREMQWYAARTGEICQPRYSGL